MIIFYMVQPKRSNSSIFGLGSFVKCNYWFSKERSKAIPSFTRSLPEESEEAFFNRFVIGVPSDNSPG